MTINSVVNVTGSAWVNLHSASGISVGTQIVIQDRSPEIGTLYLVNSVAEPVLTIEEAGGLRTKDQFETITSTPDVGESTWGRRLAGTDSAGVSVQG